MKMEIRINYLINAKTVVFKGVYYKNGELITVVVEGDDKFLVAQSPVQIIKHSLLSYGSDFNGALNSSKELLGTKINLHPIMVSGTLDLWIFPTKSYKEQYCIWFVLNQIQGTERLGVKQTKVSLSYGHSIELQMKEISFKNKRDNAKELRDKITNNGKNPLSFLLEPRKGFCLVEGKGEYKSIKKDK
ncbi:competence protein ComK [Bacillus sp. EB600]|uniref:competence protein ComK n=1 Tax=Bacillus sp. EB600 TaxID=2806345 RepID=UPI00210DEA49|nr:competence protein ComK [Bacillus sp. EB600]MCQ6281598.1 competence protein ComK [Bacillus sp. EB600]